MKALTKFNLNCCVALFASSNMSLVNWLGYMDARGQQHLDPREEVSCDLQHVGITASSAIANGTCIWSSGIWDERDIVQGVVGCGRGGPT